MRNPVNQRIETYFAAKKSGEIFHADVDVGGQNVRLVVASGVDGWLCVVCYPAPEESIQLGQYAQIQDAELHMEEWVGVVHNIRSEIRWIAGPSSMEGSKLIAKG